MARKPENMQEKSDPYPFFFSSNITRSIIVVTNMAAFQFNYSVICIPKKSLQVKETQFRYKKILVRPRSHWASSLALT